MSHATRDPTRRWVRVGHASEGGPRRSGAAAARAALDGPDPKLLTVFASYTLDPHEVVEGVRDQAGAVPFIGCTSAGEIGPDAVATHSVVAVGFGGDFDVTAGAVTDIGQRPRQAGEEIASALLPLPARAHQFAIMLTASLAGDQQEMLRGSYGMLGATVTLAGGGAGYDMRTVSSHQFLNGKIMQDAVVAACVGSDAPAGLAVRHGWKHSGPPMMVTGSRGTDVRTFDDQPALDVYLSRHRAPAGIEYDGEAFTRFALTRPISLARRGETIVRHVLGAEPATRTLRCAGNVPRGALVWLATGDATTTIDAAGQACAAAVDRLGASPPLALLVFDCVARRALLGEAGVRAEHRAMRRHAGRAPLAGFYTYGEIGRASGASVFHNQTIVALAIGDT